MSVKSYVEDLENLGAKMESLGRAGDRRATIITHQDLSTLLKSGKRVFIHLQQFMLCLEVASGTWNDENTIRVWQARDNLGAIFYGNFPGYQESLNL